MWFTSDTHFNHKAIVQYCGRPFADSKEMDEALIANWNSRIGKRDIVYHLGDFAFANTDKVKYLISALNGQITLIKGNHDYKLPTYAFNFFKEVYDLRQIKIDGQTIVMCHFPIHSWNKKHYGAWHLHGHSHGGLSFDSNIKRLDVGVDCHNYAPIHFEQVKKIFDNVFTYKIPYSYKLNYDPHGHNGDL